MAAFTIDNLRRAFSAGSFERGDRYQRQGRARIARVSADGWAIEGEGRGSGRAPYQVSAAVGWPSAGKDRRLVSFADGALLIEASGPRHDRAGFLLRQRRPRPIKARDFYATFGFRSLLGPQKRMFLTLPPASPGA